MTTQTYRAVQVSALGQFELVERDIRPPSQGSVRIRVEACGICHSDVITILGLFPDIVYPRVPGHEVIGTIDALGDGVSGWNIGQRVGVGYLGGPDFQCVPCRRGDFVNCLHQQVTGVGTDGGYAEVMFANQYALAAVPDELTPADAAPLVCAGVTMYNALRHSPARSGDLVAIQGIGGLGHLGIQFARAMGMRVVAIGRGFQKQDAALRLGAHTYIDTQHVDPAAALQALGGAKVILATAANNKAPGQLVGGLASRGTLVIVGVGGDGPLQVSPADLVFSSRSLTGALTGTTIETEDALAFSVLHGVRPIVERVRLEQAADAYSRMIRGEARFRMVLVMGA
jgi:D-arabinose 1-dehydrogenase-like Zn-dependent alcohol dehydrogenase